VSSSVTKAFQVVELLAASPPSGASLADLSSQLGMPKSTAHRYLTSLVSLRLAERDGSDHFHLGTRVIELAGAYLARSDLRTEARTTMEELAAQTAETVHLAVPSAGEVVYIAKVESIHPIRMYSHIGARLPMYCTALGKAILPFLPEERRERILGQPFRARTERTIVSPQVMRDELELIRTQGFAIDDEENEVGVCCVGAPVFDYTTDVVGALSVSGPTSRMSRERCIELGPLVHDSAWRVSRRMGYPS
jgi:IclR family acetate operon transcriptional repressor